MVSPDQVKEGAKLIGPADSSPVLVTAVDGEVAWFVAVRHGEQIGNPTPVRRAWLAKWATRVEAGETQETR